MELKFLDTQCVGICTPDELRRNMAYSVSLGFPSIKKLESNWRPLAIVGGGPSLKDDIDKLRNWKAQHPHAEIWAVNGALGWLIERGVMPDGFVMMDPHHSMAQFLNNPPAEPTYYMCSFCDPSVFDCLTGRNVVLWHAGDKLVPPPEGEGVVGGGPTVLTRAPMLAYCLGYRDVHLFGADSSYDDGVEHCYDVTYGDGVTLDEHMPVLLDGKIYISSIVHLHQVAYFQRIHDWYSTRGARFEIHGRGLGPAMLKAPMHTIQEAMSA